jgi:hypothetical protein
MLKRSLEPVIIEDVIKLSINSNGDTLVKWTWQQDVLVNNIAFKIITDKKTEYALISPNATEASYFIRSKSTKKMIIIPSIGGFDEIENSREVEIK